MVEVFGNLFSGNIVKGSKFSYSQIISSLEHGSSRNHLLKFDLHSMGQLPVLRSMVDAENIYSKHHDLQKQRIKRDEEDVKKVVQMFVTT